jgi:hypothetical protein
LLSDIGGLLLIVTGLIGQPQLGRQIADRDDVGRVHLVEFFEALELAVIRPQRHPELA